MSREAESRLADVAQLFLRYAVTWPAPPCYAGKPLGDFHVLALPQ